MHWILFPVDRYVQYKEAILTYAILLKAGSTQVGWHFLHGLLYDKVA